MVLVLVHQWYIYTLWYWWCITAGTGGYVYYVVFFLWIHCTGPTGAAGTALCHCHTFSLVVNGVGVGTPMVHIYIVVLVVHHCWYWWLCVLCSFFFVDTLYWSYWWCWYRFMSLPHFYFGCEWCWCWYTNGTYIHCGIGGASLLVLVVMCIM